MYMDEGLKAVVAGRRMEGLGWWTKTFGNPTGPRDFNLHFSPDSETCCGQTMDSVRMNSNAQLFTPTFFPFERSTVSANVCKMCGKVSDFDGRQYGVLNYNNNYLFDIGRSHS